MDYKKTKAPDTTVTRDMNVMSEGINTYEMVNIIAKRSNQIAVEMKQELTKKLEEYSSPSDNLEEIFENREQIAISRYYERLPKPTLIATQEYIDGEIYHRNPSEMTEEA